VITYNNITTETLNTAAAATALEYSYIT
jgi:hypothetical protein